MTRWNMVTHLTRVKWVTDPVHRGYLGHCSTMARRAVGTPQRCGSVSGYSGDISHALLRASATLLRPGRGGPRA